MGTKRLWLLLGGVAVLGLAVVGYIVLGSPEEAPEVGAQAPDFTVATLDGSTVTLSDFRGNPVLLNFWATWCSWCTVEMPYIQAVFEEREGEGLVVLAVNLKEEQSTIESFMQERGYTFLVGLDRDGSVAADYGVGPIPITFFIDGDGTIRYIKVGAFPSEAALESALGSIM